MRGRSAAEMAEPYQEMLHVLLVEDDPSDTDRLRAVFAQLEEPGAILVNIDVAKTYDEAYSKVLSGYYDLIVVDLVLHEGFPGDSEDLEGLWLLQDLFDLELQEQTAVIILTGFDVKTETISQAFTQFSVVDFWTKQVEIDVLVDRFRGFLVDKGHFGLTTKVDFEGVTGWSELVLQLGETPFRRLQDPLSLPDAELELNHLLRRLTRECRRIVVSRVDPGNSGAAVLRVARESAEGPRLSDVLVKFGAAGMIREEIQRWEEVRELIQNFRFTQLQASATGRYLGAIEYTLIGANNATVMPFAEFYETRDVIDVERCVASLFRETCSLWYAPESRVPVYGASLMDHYAQCLGFTSESIERAFAFKFGPDALIGDHVELAELPRALPHPVKGIAEGWQPPALDTFHCPTHGDLHGGNLFVDAPSGAAWLIDFAGTGLAHWARDFCMLETSIKFQYLPATSLERLFAFEDSLVNVGSLDADWAASWDDDPYFAKAARAIRQIRLYAAEVVADRDPEKAFNEYCVALFYTTISQFRFHALLKRRVRKRQILLAAALLYERLLEES